MYNLTIENEYGRSLTFNQVGGAYQITEIEGLSSPEADIHTTTTALYDGEKFNSAKTQMRTMNIAFAIDYSAEYYRLEAYKVLHVKKPVKISYKTTMVDVYIEGIVQHFDVKHFEAKQIATLTVVCPKPYWIEAQEMINELSATLNKFHFPFASTEEPELVFGKYETKRSVSINNESSTECGMTIELRALAGVTNPKVINYVTGEFIGINISMQTADEIFICTEEGNKTAYLLRSGVKTNLFNLVMEGSDWLQLDIGGNEFVYTVSGGNEEDLLVTFRHHGLREGV